MNREEKSKNSKDKIIQSAFSLFASKGYDATSTQDIINLSGLSRGAMYHHFKSKEGILRSVTEGFYSYMNNFLEDLVADTTLTAKEKIMKLITHNAIDYKHQQMIKMINMTHGFWYEKIPFALLEQLRYLNDVAAPYFSKIIEQGIENHEYSCEYPRELAELLLFAVDTLLNPILFKRSYSEICSRLDFLFLILQKIDMSIINSNELNEIKDNFKQIFEYEGRNYESY